MAKVFRSFKAKTKVRAHYLEVKKHKLSSV